MSGLRVGIWPVRRVDPLRHRLYAICGFGSILPCTALLAGQLQGIQVEEERHPQASDSEVMGWSGLTIAMVG